MAGLNMAYGGYNNWGGFPYGGYANGYNQPFSQPFGQQFNQGFNAGFYGGGFGNNALAPGWQQILNQGPFYPSPPDPREPFSPFNFNATVRDDSAFYVYGAPNEFQALVALQNPEMYWQVYDQAPNPAYYQMQPSWTTAYGNAMPGYNPQYGGRAGPGYGQGLNVGTQFNRYI